MPTRQVSSFRELDWRDKKAYILHALKRRTRGEIMEVTADDVALYCRISVATARKYLRRLVMARVVTCRPPLAFKSCGSAMRRYRYMGPRR